MIEQAEEEWRVKGSFVRWSVFFSAFDYVNLLTKCSEEFLKCDSNWILVGGLHQREWSGVMTW